MTKIKRNIHAVTGAFGYSGRHIVRHLLAQERQVITLTNSPAIPNLFSNSLQIHPLDFSNVDKLTHSLEGVSVLYNTYWVRFNHPNFSHEQTVKNSGVLFQAARKAGVERIVHVSITNPDIHSTLSYFKGKAQVEALLAESGVAHSILRPAVLFGGGDILINNIAWALRRFPVFAIFGNGQYRLQPIHVEDFADLAIHEADAVGNRLIQAIGPETFTYRELVHTLGKSIGRERPLLRVSPRLGYALSYLIGACVKDVFITQDEITGLMENRLCVEAPPSGSTSLSQWIQAHSNSLGKHYANELARRQITCSA